MMDCYPFAVSRTTTNTGGGGEEQHFLLEYGPKMELLPNRCEAPGSIKPQQTNHKQMKPLMYSFCLSLENPGHLP